VALVLVAALLQVVTLAGPVSQVSADEVGTAPTEAEALKVARASGKNVEVTGLRGEAREVYAHPDGLLEGVEHLTPVRTIQKGSWVSVNTNLKWSGTSVVPTASAVGVVFSGGGAGPLVRLSRAGREIALTWPGSLPTPVLKDDTATYGDVIPGVDLQLRAESDGFAQLLVVRTAEAAQDPRLSELKLAMQAKGLRVEQDSTGLVRAVDTATGVRSSRRLRQ
jgi:hypothetical protein